MAREYTVAFSGVASTVQCQFFELTPTANKPIQLLRAQVGQDSDAQDANEALLRVEIWRGTTSTGAGGTAVTPKILGTTGVAAGFTAQTMSTALGSTASAELLLCEPFNSRAGWYYTPLPEERFDCSTAQYRFVVRLGAAPSSSFTFSGTALVRELA